MRHRSPSILRGGLLILGCALVAAPVWGDEVDDFVRATSSTRPNTQPVCCTYLSTASRSLRMASTPAPLRAGWCADRAGPAGSLSHSCRGDDSFMFMKIRQNLFADF